MCVGALGHNDSLRWQREGRASKRRVFLSGGRLSGGADRVSILSGTNNLKLGHRDSRQLVSETKHKDYVC